LKTNNPLVSVVITTIGQREIRKAIDSVLNSSYKNFELIVVNDGAKINLTEKGFCLINQEHKGLAAARNTGIKKAKGEIIAFIDDDAVAEKNWLKEIVSSFVSAEIGAVSGKSIEYFEGKTTENRLWVCNKFGLIKVNPKKLEKNDFIVLHGCNMALSKKVLQKVNFEDENFIFYFDEIDLSWRIQKAGFKIAVNPNAIVRHFIKSNARFGNKFGFGKFKYYFALKNFNSLFFLPLLLLNDFPFLLNDLKRSFQDLLKKKLSLKGFLIEFYSIFAGRVFGTGKAFIDLIK